MPANRPSTERHRAIASPYGSHRRITQRPSHAANSNVPPDVVQISENAHRDRSERNTPHQFPHPHSFPPDQSEARRGPTGIVFAEVYVLKRCHAIQIESATAIPRKQG